MTQVVLENLSPEVIEKLLTRAKSHNRSLSDEIKTIIEQVIEAEVRDKEALRATWREKLEQARQKHGNQVFSDSVELLREDRQR